jgi:hypothetical protein
VLKWFGMWMFCEAMTGSVERLVHGGGTGSLGLCVHMEGAS